MSHYMTALAMKQPYLRPATKIVLYWLADHHNGETGECFPSISRLSKCCEMEKSAVHRHLCTLETKGLISRQRRWREDGGFTSNFYVLHLEDPMSQNDIDPSSKMQHPPMAKRDTNLGSNNLGSNNNIYMNTTHKTITEFDEWWDTYPRKVEKYKAATLFPKIRLEVEFDVLIEATKKYAEAVKDKEKKFIPHPTTWLNGRRWNDPIEAPQENNMKKTLEELGLSYE